MSHAPAVSRSQTASSAVTAPSIRKALVELWRTVTRDFTGEYHPERYYMRGPGPKWHAKHVAVAIGESGHGLSGSLSTA
jgi:hypothetical protein